MYTLIYYVSRTITRTVKFCFFSEYTIFVPVMLSILFIGLLFFYGKKSDSYIRKGCFNFFLSIFIFYFLIFIIYSRNLNGGYFLLSEKKYTSGFINLTLVWGIDNVSIFFLLLTSLIFTLCILINWNYDFNDFKLFTIVLLLLQIFLINAFTCLNLLGFYFFFESTLLPMFFIISVWGSRPRKNHAAYLFFFYTAFGSVFLIAGMTLLYNSTHTFDIRLLSTCKISETRQIVLWFLFFIGFIVKLPLPPFHSWLPEAHVEAPTAGSMILAGILLKLGSYGIFRFMLPVLTYANNCCAPFVYLFCSASALYISALACRQIDIKKIIAYSSIAHMCFVLIGLFTFSKEGIAGSIFLMIGHGLISAGLFACIGIIYIRYKTRLLTYYSNLSKIMPLFTRVFFYFILSNAAFPLLSPGFVAEVFITISVAKVSVFTLIMMLFTIIFTAIYCFSLYNKISNTEDNYLNNPVSGYNDLTKQEMVVCLILIFFSVVLGTSPEIILDKVELISQYAVIRNGH